jgi:hypothetical protein
LERNDGTEEIVEKWEFDSILDCHNEDGFHYLVKWKHQPATWQPAKDLQGQNEVLLEFHRQHPEKPDPPSWVKKPASPTGPRRSLRLRSIHSLVSKCVRFAPLVRAHVF